LYEKTPIFKPNTFSDDFYKNINMERIKFILDRGRVTEALLKTKGIFSEYSEDTKYVNTFDPYYLERKMKTIVENRKLEIRLDKTI
jgi:hypothetical protein